MSTERLKYLRKLNVLTFNILFALAALIFFVMLYYGIEIKHFYIGVASLLVVTTIGLVYENTSIVNKIVPQLKELKEYEKQKLGGEWKKNRRNTVIGNIILIALMLFQAFALNYDSILSLEELGYQFLLTMLVILYIFLNFSLYFHSKKIDRSNGNLQGFSQQTLVKGLIVGFVVAIIIVLVITFTVIFRIG